MDENNDRINDSTIQIINSTKAAIGKLREIIQRINNDKKELNNLRQERNNKEESRRDNIDTDDYWNANNADNDSDTGNERIGDNNDEDYKK